ncbi:unnamed protein product [Sphagnum balticum]
MRSLFLLAVLLLQCLRVVNCLGSAGVSFLEQPPVGNTLSMSYMTQNGQKMYKCLQGKWEYQGGESEILDARTLATVGAYREIIDPVKKTISGWWELVNDSGDKAESGHQYSTVTGEVIETVTTQSPQAATSLMYVAIQHDFVGKAALISYIAVLNEKGGNVPGDSFCTVEGEVVEVPFTADFAFYTQDTTPPALPQSISATLASVQPMESFYAQGVVRYTWTGQSWKSNGVAATLYTVPGGPVVGEFSSLPKPDKLGGQLYWIAFGPNGFSITGRANTAPVVVSKNSIGWQLVEVTSSNGSTLEGPYKYVLMTSTMGGLLPSSIKPMAADNDAAAGGLVMTSSSFSCVFWIYTT